jgi:hypothetical protein
LAHRFPPLIDTLVRHKYKVVVNGRSFVHTDDVGIAIHIADTREIDASSLVMDREGQTIYDRDDPIRPYEEAIVGT